MKTVITSVSDNLNTEFDKRFGRAAWFCVLDESTGEVSFVKNEYADNDQGAGTKVAALMVELGVKKVISGHFGPKAQEVLKKFDVQMVATEEETSVSEIINKLKNR